ncbi:MAG: 1-deoxy-D-xylulose-5-phosphate synthase [Candidatus Edwardsbacteria bacterium]
MSLLETINSPQDLKRLNLFELTTLAEEIREKIIEVVSKRGGHLAPSLGVVELTLALHYVFDTPRDKIIWDVGHQCYAHKLITERRRQFDSLRTYGGLSGFPKRKESSYDVFDTGHASTSLSAALGIAIARDFAGEDFKVIAVIGDGAMTGGISFEGLNNIGQTKRNLLVILNDNKMAISKRVGALGQYLTKITTTPIYTHFEKDVWELLGRLPSDLGGKARILARRVREGIKNLLVPGMTFEELGFHYEGPVDGHNLQALIEILERLKNLKGPILLHILTVKGKGYKFAEADASKFHGVSPFDPETGDSRTQKGIPSYTEVFGKTLVKFAEEDKRIVAITAAMPEGTGLNYFAEEIPERFFDVGIAEQHAVTFAAGLATQGMKPVVAIYSTFLQRAFDQIIHDVALMNLPVVFALDRGGLVGEDGPTHHGAFDLSYLRQIPNLVVMAPKDELELVQMLKTALDYSQGPIAFRYPRGSGIGIPIKENQPNIKIGKGEILSKKGDDALILSIGAMVHPSLKAAKILQTKKIKPTVINARFAKPLDEALLKKLTRRIKKIVTIEENVLSGGFGSAVMEFFEREGIRDIQILRVGLPDHFIEHGSRDLLLEKFGLTPERIAEKVEKFVKESLTAVR